MRFSALQGGLLERRDRGPLSGDEALLLRDVERRSRAHREAALDGFEHAFRSLRILARDAQAVLRPENGEVGVRHRRGSHERHHIAIEAARLRQEPPGSRIRRVEPPEIHLVARRKSERKDIARRGSKRPSLVVERAGGAGAGRIGIGIERRVERGPYDLRLSLRLDNSRESRRNVEIPGLCIGGKARELQGAEFAWPIDGGRWRRHGSRRTIRGGRLDRELRIRIVEEGTGEQRHCAEENEGPRHARAACRRSPRKRD